YDEPGRGGRGSGDGPRGPRRRKGRIRRFFRLRTVRVILALIAVFMCWVAFSVGQALTAPGGGSTSAKLAEWARDHYLGPVVTFGEWVTYQPPAKGGNPSFNMSVPKGAGASDPSKSQPHPAGFQPVIPATLSSVAGKA